MKQKSVGLTLRAFIIALALILVAGSPALPPLTGVAYAQTSTSTLTGDPLPNGDVPLEWTAVANADSYRLWKGEGSGSTVSWGSSAHMTFDAPTVSYTDTAGTAGMTYSYVVEIYDGTTRLGWSNIINVTIPGGTQAPTAKPSLTLTADGLTAIDISWPAIQGADHYQARYWTSGLSGWTDIGGQITGTGTVTYKHTGLNAGTQYWYIVRAVNAGGDGPWSGSPGQYDSLTLEATTTVPQLTLTHPERLRVELSWTRTSANAMYQVQRKVVTVTDGAAAVDSGWSNLGDAQSGNTYTDTTVTYGVTDGDSDTTNDSVIYHYQVQAIENGVQGDYSNVRMATIPASNALPPVPAGLSATAVSSSRINVAWSPVAGATSHQIQFKVGDGNYGAAMTRTAPYLHTGLSADTEYTYQVRSVNVNGHSAWSAEVSATTLAATATGDRLSTPTGLKAVAAVTAGTDTILGTTDDVTNITVTWNASVKATSYELRKWSGTEWAAVTPALTETQQMERSYVDADVAEGMTFYYIVAALNDSLGTPTDTTDDDMSDWSSPASVETKAIKPQNAPADLTATARGEDRIWVSWTAATGATEYVLQWRLVGSSTWHPINVTGGRVTYAHMGRSPGTTYQYQVAAKNSGGMSAWSAEVAGKTWARALSTPTGLTAVDATTDTAPAVKLTWNMVNGAAGYEIQKWVGAAWTTLDLSPDDATGMHTTMTTYTDTHDVPSGNVVAAGTTYYYIVRAVSGDVASAWSSAMSGMTKATMPTVAAALDLVPTGQTTVRLTWAPGSGDTATYTGWELQYVKGAATAAQLDDARFNKMSMTLAASPMHHIMRNLEVGTLYSYRIRGTLPLGVMGTWSAVESIVTRPATPRLTASSASSTSITLSWAVVNPPGFVAGDALDNTDYELQRRKSGQTAWTTVDLSAVTCTTTCSVTDTDTTGDNGIEGGMRYFYRLRIETTPSTTVTGHPEVTSYWSNASARTPASQ